MSRPIFTAITSEGGLLPADFLQTLLAPKPTVDGLKPTDYHLDPNDRLNDVIAGSWNKLRSRWQTFRSKIEGRLAGDSTTSETRELWLQPLLGELGFGRVPVVRGLSFGDRTFDISHQWDSIPLHLVGTHVDLDQRTPGATGASRGSPHSILQQLLNADPQRLWGVVSNGWQLRLLRDNAALTRQAYIEFDLQAIFDGDLYPEFVVLWLVLHQSRFELREGQLARCWLEMWRQAADQKGLRALEHLRYGVESAITSLGAGLLSNPLNGPLREALSSGQLTTQALYQQILRTVYRMIFLFVAEDRGLLHPRDSSEAAVRARARYASHYSLSRLRELHLNRAGTPHPDLWIVVQLVTRKLGEEGATELALPILGSFLWSAGATKDLNGCVISNRQFLEAVHALAFTQEEGGLKRTVDYRNLGAEELGSVYEGLLEQHVSVDPVAQSFTLDTAAGNERKTSGSYYTPDSLVQCLLDSALEPVIAQAVRGKMGEVAAKALLALRICDPAVGSGHFLIAAAHRLAKRVAAARTGEEEPSPDATRTALRDVISHCLYGVDINPMSAELCRVSLWLEALEPGKPLSFLDHHIRCGNSLIGATPELIKGGIPDEAYEPLEGDDKEACSTLKKKNKRENPKLGEWFMADEAAMRDRLQQAAAAIDEMSDIKAEDIRRKEAAFRATQSDDDFGKAWGLANLWCAAFVIKKHFPGEARVPASVDPAIRNPQSSTVQIGLFSGTEEIPKAKTKKTKAPSRAGNEIAIGITTQHLRDFVVGATLPEGLIIEVKRLADQYQFFHWRLAFPEVFAHGGFDVNLGNPPWERVNIEARQFFASIRPDISEAITTKRRDLIADLALSEPDLFRRFVEAQRQASGEIAFFQNSGLYLRLNQARLNTYVLFTELASGMCVRSGRVGIIVPSGIATDEISRNLFEYLVQDGRIVSLLDFENRDSLFPGVHRSYKFCLLTLGGARSEVPSRFAFFLHGVEDIAETNRSWNLTARELHLLSPISGLCPTFRTSLDREVILRVYDRVRPLATQQDSMTDWGKSDFLIMFRSDDSTHLYRTVAQLGVPDLASATLPRIEADGETYVPVWESKLLHQFDHRFATFAGVTDAERKKGTTIEVSNSAKNEAWAATPRFWAPLRNVREIFDQRGWKPKWSLGYRDITNATNERTAIATVLPEGGAAQPLNLFLPESPLHACVWVAAMNSFIIDYAVRQRIGGVHLNITTCRQLPIVGLAVLTDSQKDFIRERVLELVFTSPALEAFAHDCGWSGPSFSWNEERRFLLRCELDAAFFHIYLGPESDWNRQSDALTQALPTPRAALSYILDTFPIVRRKDEQRFNGDFRTKRVILEIYDKLACT